MGSKVVPFEISTPHSYSTSAHTILRLILHRLATIQNATDRWIDIQPSELAHYAHNIVGQVYFNFRHNAAIGGVSPIFFENGIC